MLIHKKNVFARLFCMQRHSESVSSGSFIRMVRHKTAICDYQHFENKTNIHSDKLTQINIALNNSDQPN